ncbi:MAG: hypothetical protein HeimC3_12120 [Candidatus Heimdallarchaeota archaeon LC_3]|nr:MAG: hypothetical protein HeimC3_12120 [Candidatus Heimdallarchaeota archaeon LC_3]
MSPSSNKDDEKKSSRSFKKAIDASKVLVGALAIKAADEISKIVVNPPKKPKNVTRREYTKSKPTKTFTQAARAVKFWGENPSYFPKTNSYQTESAEDKKDRGFFYSPDRQYKKPPPSVVPGLDGLVSFSILLVPFAILLGIINQIFVGILIDILLWFLLLIYILFIAVPGAYLGLDAIRDGAKELLASSGATIKFGLKGIFYMIKIFFQGLAEIFLLFFSAFFENVLDYWIFVSTYIISLIILYFTITAIFGVNLGLFTIMMLILIPALLPAAILHRYWLLFRFNQEKR